MNFLKNLFKKKIKKITVWNYLDELKSEKKEVLSAIKKVLDSGILILGDNVKEFENKFSKYCNSNYGIGVNSATDALFLTMRSFGLKKGDEVISVSNTAVPTISSIVAANGTPRFVDIDPNSYLMDVNKLEKSITKKTKGVIVVHLFGQCVDMDPVIEICKRRKIFLIEDCSQSHCAKYKNKIAGSMSDASVFSFYPTKILGGYGDAGMVVTNNKKINDNIKKLRFYGMEKTYYSILEEGYNSRLDEMHAAILINKLKHLDYYIERRRKIAKVYQSKLKDTSLILPCEKEYNKHSFYVYVVRHKKRDEILQKLKEKNIFLNISYPWPIHTMTGFKQFGFKEGDLPVTEKVAKEIFSLPMYPYFDLKKQLYFIETLKQILK